MSKQFSNLKMLSVDKTVVFWSPVEGEDVLIRTGTISDGSSFLHSLIYAYSKEYVSMDEKGRRKFIKRLRASMAGQVNRDSWEEMGGGLIAKIPFQESVNYTLINLYRFFDDDPRARGRTTKNILKKLLGNKQENLDLYKIIMELIPLDEFEENILPIAYENSDEGKISDCCDEIIRLTIDYLENKDELKNIPKEKSEYIKNIVRIFIEQLLTECEKQSFKNFVKGLENSKEDIDSYTIELISNRFKRDIYFLNSEDRMPYSNSTTRETLKGRKSLILLWINKNHYEIVGRLLPGNRIQREFSHDDPLIQKLYNYLLNPSLISEKYPELKAYVSKDIENLSDTISNVSLDSYGSENFNKESHEDNDSDDKSVNTDVNSLNDVNSDVNSEVNSEE
jgi:hypothetical protein